MGLIDVHCHYTPADLPPCPCAEAAPRWPQVHRQGVVEATLELGTKPFRKIDNRSWDGSRRLDDMDASAVDVQVISPMPELLSYWFDLSSATQLCEHINHGIGAIVDSAPSRFRGLGMIPMQYPEEAAAMLRDLRTKFGLAGVEIGSNIDGVALGDPRFDPVFAAAEELGLAIFVHALHPAATKNTGMPPTAVPLVGFPIDTAIAAVALIYAGIRTRYPRLRVGFSHGGGALGPLLHRLDRGWKISGGFEGTMAIAPGVQASGFYFDSLVYSDSYLRYLAMTVAPGNVFVGTDYPYALMDSDPRATIARCDVGSAESEAMRSAAALRFLGESNA